MVWLCWRSAFAWLYPWRSWERADSLLLRMCVASMSPAASRWADRPVPVLEVEFPEPWAIIARASSADAETADFWKNPKWSGWWDCCAALGPSGTALRCSLLLPLVAARTHFVASHPTHPTNSVELVGVVGFEPTTYSSQSYRAARLRYTPSKRNVDNAFSWLVCQLLMLAYFACFVALAR